MPMLPFYVNPFKHLQQNTEKHWGKWEKGTTEANKTFGNIDYKLVNGRVYPRRFKIFTLCIIA